MRPYLLYAIMLAAVAAVVVISPVLLAKAWRSHWLASYEDVVPQPIEVAKVLSAGGQTGLVREGCGGVVFQLSRRTVAAVEKQGLAFFANAIQGRGHPLATDGYAKWRETPVPAGWLSDGLPPSFSCMGNDRALDAAIFEALRSHGSYFTTKPEAALVVIPKLKIAVFAYNG